MADFYSTCTAPKAEPEYDPNSVAKKFAPGSKVTCRDGSWSYYFQGGGKISASISAYPKRQFVVIADGLRLPSATGFTPENQKCFKMSHTDTLLWDEQNQRVVFAISSFLEQAIPARLPICVGDRVRLESNASAVWGDGTRCYSGSCVAWHVAAVGCMYLAKPLGDIHNDTVIRDADGRIAFCRQANLTRIPS